MRANLVKKGIIKMKFIIITVLIVASYSLFSQSTKQPEPFLEARKAMASVERAKMELDSLWKCYKGRWTLNITYGQRFIASYNKTNRVDSLTLADFTTKRAFYGLGTHYFISRKVLIGAALEFLILPKQQDVISFPGGGRGEGSGGLMFSANLSAKYFFKEWGNTRTYLGLALGRDNLVIKGGTVEFSFFSGRVEDIDTITKDVFSANLSTGLSHRMSPGSLIDFNIGYSHTTSAGPIGGITSPGGFKASLSLQFVLNPQKK